jgi:hypothetical protein
MTVVDPTNDNYAIVDGELAVAVRVFPAGAIADPSRPTVAELNRAAGVASILGYGGFSHD